MLPYFFFQVYLSYSAQNSTRPQTVSQADFLDKAEGANTERCAYGKIAVDVFRMPPFWPCVPSIAHPLR